LVTTLTRAFDNLPDPMKWLHAAALAAVALSVVLLMTPAALHRLAFHGEDDPDFSKSVRGLSSRLPFRSLWEFLPTSPSSLTRSLKEARSLL
jgi:hypothetical protein